MGGWVGGLTFYRGFCELSQDASGFSLGNGELDVTAEVRREDVSPIPILCRVVGADRAD